MESAEWFHNSSIFLDGGRGGDGRPNIMKMRNLNEIEDDGKGKAVPLQAWSGPEGSRKLRFPDFVTMAQDGDRVVSLTHQPPLPPGNTPGTHFY